MIPPLFTLKQCLFKNLLSIYQGTVSDRRRLANTHLIISEHTSSYQLVLTMLNQIIQANSIISQQKLHSLRNSVFIECACCTVEAGKHARLGALSLKPYLIIRY